MPFLRSIARPILASNFIWEGINRLRDAEENAPEIGKTLESITNLLPIELDDQNLTRAIATSEIIAGSLLTLGKFTKFSGLILAKISILNMVIDWKKADLPIPESEEKRRANLAKNLSVLGGTLYALTDRKGKPSFRWLMQHKKHEKAAPHHQH